MRGKTLKVFGLKIYSYLNKKRAKKNYPYSESSCLERRYLNKGPKVSIIVIVVIL